MRVVLAVGILACVTATAYAERIEASAFLGVDWFGRAELGNASAPEQVPGTSPLVGVRAAWLAVPRPGAALQLAIEAELAFAPAFTGDSVSDDRPAFFAPVFAWRAHGLVRLARWRAATPHLVVGAGGQTIMSASPYMATDTDPIAYWGPGVRVPVVGRWHLRVDVRHGVVPARNGGATSTFEAELGLGTTFGQRPAPPVRPAAAPPPVDNTDRDRDGIPDHLDGCPAEPESVNQIVDDDGCPEPDPDGDGVLDTADRCPEQAEDVDGFDDRDGCPDPDNDGDAIADGRDACPAEPEALNSFEDDDGCPDLLPAEITAALDTVVRFEAGRARVTPAAAATLAPVLAMLQKHTAVRLAIVGHPDRAGGDDLARRRAEAVKWYLVDQGIAEDRIAARVGPVATTAVAFQLVRPAP